MKRLLALGTAGVLFFSLAGGVFAQSLGNAGTIEGAVTDPSGAAVAQAQVSVHNAVTGYQQSAVTGQDGTFKLSNLPPNPYHMEIKASGFETFTQDVSIRSSVPIQVKATMAVAGSKQAITVEAAGADMLEVDPSAHTDADRNLIVKLPAIDPGAGLSQAITYSTGGVAADGNGFFHPLGDHAQVSFNIDGQEVSDQQSKVFSTQLPASAVQSMELVTGFPGAEFGDKTSLVVNVTTRSGLGANRWFGNVDTDYGSFGTTGGSIGLGYGNAKFGNFLAVDGVRSGRFLDTPEYTPFHDKGNNQTFFDRVDFQPTQNDSLHLNLFAARNWIQIPNDYDQLGQDQRQRVLTWSVAPGYQHTFNPHVLWTVNPYIRKDQFNYYGSRDLTQDTPATENQQRQLLNWGTKSDVAIDSGRHNVKIGIDLKQTRLLENFGFGITDPTFNPVCVDQNGSAAGPDTLLNPNQCGTVNLFPNPNFSPGLLPYDLTRGGRLFAFHGTGNINQYAFYAQDAITFGKLQVTIGFRYDRYDGLTSNNGAEPRIGLAYNIKGTGTVLRASYARTMETPFNENLLLSSATGVGGLDQNVFGASSTPINPGRRNQFNTGMQQAIGKYLLLDADYFWKYTHGAFDFSTLLNTTITFPISWHNSKLDGVTGRVSTTNLKGFQAYWTFGHTRARYFPPETGGLVPQGAAIGGGVFRIDHDQAFQSTGVFRYQHKNAEWAVLTWRYDSGLVVSGVPDTETALTILTPNQQATIGLSCGGLVATYTNGGLTPAACAGQTVSSKLINLPTPGAADPDHNPARVKPRNVFNVGIGTDNLFHKEGHQHITASFNVENLTNKVALYNFLSTFSGTHFLQPRMVMVKVGFVF
jgi:hypothetical protein